MKKENKVVRSKLEKCEKLNKLLSEEKKFSYLELTKLRNELRDFLRNQLISIDKLSNKTILMDYTGGEIIERSKFDKSAKLIVFKSKMFKDGDEIRGIKGYFVKNGKIQLKIFKRLDKDIYVCVGNSEVFSVNKGKHYLELKSKLLLDDNTIIGFYFPEGINVFYSKNAENFCIVHSDILLGDKLKLSNDKCYTFSLGVMGYFN
ncbi:hypothetical protein [Deferribacter abyssi]|uniref:hypothetical protein n=1 Tax=Deferribacter abyssi TaxID=213806 RepID=UPI003C256F37